MHSSEMQPNAIKNSSFDTLNSMPSFEEWQAKNSKQDEQQVENDPKKMELFNNFIDFFKKDSNIKSTMTNLAPKDQIFYSNDEAIKYSDELYAGTKDIIADIKSIMANFYPSDTIENRLKQIETDVINAGAAPNKLVQVYRNDYSAMSIDFNNDIRKKIVGYSIFSDPHQFDSKANSINEILHLIHSAIVNDESILQSLPIIEKSKNRYGTTTLYGTPDSKNPIATEIYNQIKNSYESVSDIVSLKDRTLMMVRDRGHALTIDIEKDPYDAKYYISYFIPKICNVNKVNQLPGVRKVTRKTNGSQFAEYTTGIFSIENETDVPNAVTSFIEMVPTDDDINAI